MQRVFREGEYMKKALIYIVIGIAIWAIVFSFIFFRKNDANRNPDLDNMITVISTTSIIFDVVNNIAEDKVNHISLVDYGVDPHSYQPTSKDMIQVSNADIIFVNGFNLEENLINTITNSTQLIPIELSFGIDPIHFDEEDEGHVHEGSLEHEEGDIDPHTWMSPLSVIVWVENIVIALSEVDPENSQYYRTNGEKYIDKLLELDQYAKSKFNSIEIENRLLITDHNLFGYFARDYGFRVIGSIIPGFSSVSEASSKEILYLVETIDSELIPAIFISSTASENVSRLGESIKEELDSELKILPLLTGSLATPGNIGSDYLSFAKYNIDTIYFGLTGEK